MGVYTFFLIVWVVHEELCVSQCKKLEPVCAEVIAFLYLECLGKNLFYRQTILGTNTLGFFFSIMY